VSTDDPWGGNASTISRAADPEVDAEAAGLIDGGNILSELPHRCLEGRLRLRPIRRVPVWASFVLDSRHHLTVGDELADPPRVLS
jgi:hypothetical protein